MAGEQAKDPISQFGEMFANQYYTVFDTQKESLPNLYHEQAMITFEDFKGQGHAALMTVLQEKMKFQRIKHIVTKCDCQPTTDGGYLILVTGRLQTDDDHPHGFSQVFTVRDIGNQAYFIFNDLFRLSLHDA